MSPPGAVSEYSQILLDRDECLHRVGLRFNHTATSAVIDTHRIQLSGIIGIAFQDAFASIHHYLTAKIRTGLHLYLGGIR